MRGVEITRLLLAVARRQPLEVARYDLNQLVEQMMPLVRSSVGSAITVRVQFAAGPLIAALDAASLSNVVLNLVINARDAMRDRPGPKILTLRTRGKSIETGSDPDLKEGRYAVLEVGDTGTGMSPAVRAQAFEPFFTTKERGKGTGLGLSMAHGYATQLGGTIRIESAEGVGTTMRVFLPTRSLSPSLLPRRRWRLRSVSPDPRRGAPAIGRSRQHRASGFWSSTTSLASAPWHATGSERSDTTWLARSLRRTRWHAWPTNASTCCSRMS
jgi:hypothetical protein